MSTRHPFDDPFAERGLEAGALRDGRPAVDADLLVALAEDRLLPHEEAALLERIRDDAVARRELALLDADRYAALFPARPLVDSDAPAGMGAGGGSPDATVLPMRPRSRWAPLLAACALAAAAALFVTVYVPPPPEGSLFEAERERAVRGDLAVGERLRIKMKIGRAPGLAGVLGEPWGGLIHIQPDGVATLLCRSDALDGPCTISEAHGTLTYSFLAEPKWAGRNTFLFVTSADEPEAVIRALDGEASGLSARLDALPVRVQRVEPVDIRP